MSEIPGVQRLDTFCKGAEALRKAAWKLQHRAGACDLLGMAQLAADLYDIADDIETATEDLSRIYREESYETYISAQRSSDNMLRAALAGLKVGMEAGEDSDDEE